MKGTRRPTRAQKELISGFGLDPAEWLVLEHTERELRLIRKADESIEIIIKRR